MKRSQLLLATIALPLDYVLLTIAGILAYQLRFESFVKDIRPVQFYLPLGDYLPTVFVVAAVCLVLFAIAGLYSLTGQLKLSQEIGRLFLACSTGLALVIALFFFNPTLFASRFIVLAAWGLAFIFTSLGRVGLRLVRAAFYKRGIGVSRVLLVGDDEASRVLEQLFQQAPGLGVKVLRRLAPGEIFDLDIAASGVDEVIIGDPTLPHSATLGILEYCVTHHLGFKYAADIFEAQSHNVVIHTLAGIPLVEIKRTPLDGWGRVLKRLFDIGFSSLFLIILSPILLILVLVIYLEGGSPIIVSLERIGESGQPFFLYKFRSMIKNAHLFKEQLKSFNERADGPLFKMTNDPRVTPVGRWLRRASLDELPQLWNVLRGEMSLVGPRPHEPQEVAAYEMRQHKLLNVKPGITGLAQISGRSNLNFADEARLDTFYIENWSLATDIIILIKTVVVVLQRQSAV